MSFLFWSIVIIIVGIISEVCGLLLAIYSFKLVDKLLEERNENQSRTYY